MSVNRSNFTLIFLKAVCHANHDAVRKREGQVNIFQDTYL